MTKLKETDFIPVEEFELFWRWADEGHNILPDNILQLIHPLSLTKSAEYHQKSLLFLPSMKSGKYFDCEIGDEQTKEWLLSLGLIDSTEIVISWAEKICVVTTIGVFIQYWDDFCYPSSDQALIWSEDNDWVLFYDDNNSFTLSTKTAHLTTRSS